MVTTQRFHCQGPGSIPGQGTKIPQAMWPKKNKEKGKEVNHNLDAPGLGPLPGGFKGLPWLQNVLFPSREVQVGLFFIYKFIYFIYLFLAAVGLCCCVWAFSSCGERGLLIVAVRGLLMAVASLVAEHGL